MKVFKLNCRWEIKHLYFYKIMKDNSIAISMDGEHSYSIGDLILVVESDTAKAIIKILSEPKPFTSMPELKNDLPCKKIETLAHAKIYQGTFYELNTYEQFHYPNSADADRREITEDEIKNKTISIFREKKLIELLEANKNLVLTGAPGTGKTYLAKEIAKKLTGAENNEDKKSKEYWDFVQFHPSYDYTDFVEGLRPVQDDEGHVGFERRDGIFMAFCRKAAENYKADPEQNYVFIIDEINRAEPSRVFGELFYALEPDYRGPEGRVKTQYSNLAAEDDTFEKGFYIPKNVYIIGTMNDIDRSVDSFDFAMRRRFVWREIAVTDTQQAILSSLDELPKVNDWDWRESAIITLKLINEYIDKMPELGKAYHIGAAYMMKVKNYVTEEDQSEENWLGAWGQVWDLHLGPLLAEYLRGMPEAKKHMDSLEAYWKSFGNPNELDD